MSCLTVSVLVNLMKKSQVNGWVSEVSLFHPLQVIPIWRVN